MKAFNSIARTSLFTALISGAITLTAFNASPAFAADTDPLPQAALSVGGVDFTSPQAIAHLKRQLTHVASTMCIADADGRRIMTVDEQACYAIAVQDGLTQIDSRRQQAMRDRAIRLAASGAEVNTGL